MGKVILRLQEKIDIFDSMELLFTEMSKNGNYIEKVEDGRIYFQGKDAQVGDFSFLTNEGTKVAMEAEAIKIKDKMSEAFTLMKSQGVEMPTSEVNKLKEQFHFIAKPKTTDTEVKETEVKPTDDTKVDDKALENTLPVKPKPTTKPKPTAKDKATPKDK